MRNLRLVKLSCIVLALCVATAIASPAQATFTTLYSFCSQANCADGSFPYDEQLVQGTDGNFYGVTTYGGANNSSSICQSDGCGTVFKMTPEGTLTTLYSFCAQANCTDGAAPQAGLVQGTDGNFYGITTYGGASSSNCSDGCGTVFKITPAGELTTLHSFAGTTTEGGRPQAALVQGTDGNFYGTTYIWGASGVGTVFQITPTGTLTTLHSFAAYTTDGEFPWGGLVQATDGNFYGTTQLGGTNGTSGWGTVFKITPGGTVTILYSFCSETNCTDGDQPFGGLVQASDGNFYGTTYAGGANSTCSYCGYGTVFKITPSGTLTTLHSFAGYPTDGGLTYAGLVQATDGNFYGTTQEGGANSCLSNGTNVGCGTVFKITAGGTLTTLYSFCSQTNCTDGYLPIGGLMQATDGNFYGTTVAGGADEWGTVFSLAVTTTTVTLSPTSLNFGNQALNETSAAKTVRLENTGTATLDISGITPSGDFAISANTCKATLAVKKSCKVSVSFTPTSLGKLTGTLTLTDNASGSPQIVPLSGIGVEPATLTPTSATYAKQKVGTTSAAKTFTLTNNQTVALTDIVISPSGDFAVSATTCTTSLAEKKKCTISVTFTPTEAGTRTGQLSVSDSASNSPQVSNLTGTGK